MEVTQYIYVRTIPSVSVVLVMALISTNLHISTLTAVILFMLTLKVQYVRPLEFTLSPQGVMIYRQIQ